MYNGVIAKNTKSIMTSHSESVHLVPFSVFGGVTFYDLVDYAKN